ncbi:MAG: WG repeat-containing protein [Crocinitomicaceae bacterium]|nr:WG repeat-containing protein [Crocinitomicaceae bacterium]
MFRLSFIFILLSSFSFGQLVPGGGENCWCYPSAFDSLGNATKLTPIVYPLPVQKNGLWGAIDKEGNVVQDFISSNPTLYTGKGRAILKNFKVENYQWTANEGAEIELLDSTGKAYSKYFVEDVYKGSFLASEDNISWGLLDSKMKEILPFKYIGAHHEGEQFQFSSKGYLSIRENMPDSRFGAVDYKGQTIIPFKWKLISYLIEDEEHIYVMNEYLKRGYINIKGQTTLPFIYDKLPRELADSNMVATEKHIYFIDKKLQQIGPKYEAYERKGDVYFYKRDGKWGIMGLDNKVIIQHQYSSIMDGPRIKGNNDFKCYIVVKNGLYGLIQTTGETIITPSYECLCGLSYFAPEGYYVEFQKAEVSYKFNEKGELIEKGGKPGGYCFCE